MISGPGCLPRSAAGAAFSWTEQLKTLATSLAPLTTAHRLLLHHSTVWRQGPGSLLCVSEVFAQLEG